MYRAKWFRISCARWSALQAPTLRGQNTTLLDAVAQRLAPGLAPGSKRLFAGIAVPLRAVWPDTTSSQDVSFRTEVPGCLRGQTPIGDLLYVFVAVAPGTGGRTVVLHVSMILSRSDSRQAALVCLACDSTGQAVDKSKGPRNLMRFQQLAARRA